MNRRKLLTLAALAALAVFGVSRALQQSWSCDDAFISFRYAENLVRGHGLVYNPGERVEGYTNPLWTLLIAGFEAVGVAPRVSSVGLGIAAYLALAFVLARWSWRRGRAGAFTLPLAAALVLVLADFHTWATGGLETMFFAALATSGVLATRGELGTGRALGAGVLFALAMFTRPDGALFALVGVLSPWLTNTPRPAARRLRLSLAIGLPVLLLNGAHLWWKLGYYGELLPTSFYSKSATDPYFGQGLLYLRLLFEKNWFLLPALLAALVLAGTMRDRTRERSVADDVVFVGAGALFLAYVVYSGGDFMFARRAIPALPFLFLLLEGLVARISKPALVASLATGIVIAACFPKSLFGPEDWRIEGIADEPHFYPPEHIAARERQGAEVAAAFRDIPLRAMMQGGMCSFGYFSRLPYLVEMTGLTQMSLARSPLVERGIIGHEKSPTPEWLDENRIHLIFSQTPEHPPAENRPHNEVYLGSATGALIWLYDDAVMDPLRDREGVSFIPIELVLAQVRPAIENAPLPQARRHVADLEHYYFRSGGPKARAARTEFHQILARRERAGPR